MTLPSKVTQLRLALLVGAGLFALSAEADIRLTILPSFDDTINSAYPNGDKPQGPPNDAPVWNSTPSPGCVAGVAGSYSLANAANTADTSQHVSDSDGDALTLTSQGTTLPTGVTIDDTNDELDCSTGTSAGVTTGIVIGADDGTAARVDSSAFSITITDPSASAFTAMSPPSTILPGFSCYGCANWKTYLDTNPTFAVHYVTTTATSGAGSFDAALDACQDGRLDVIVAEISGDITYAADSVDAVACDNLIVDFQTAPSPGLHIENLRINISGDNHLWMHPSGFNDSDFNQSRGHFLEIRDNIAGNTSDIILLNPGGAFAYDGAIVMNANVTRGSIIQGMHAWPILQGSNLKQISLLGEDNPGAFNIMYFRNVGVHFTQRAPSVKRVSDSLIANNVFYDGGPQYTLVADIHDAGTDTNLIANQYICLSNCSADPIRLGASASDSKITVANNMYVPVSGSGDSNRIFGRTENGMITNFASGFITLTGSMTGTTPNGFAVTNIGAGDAGEQEFSLLVCAHAGPRPADRLAIWQQVCDEIENRFDGVGSTGTQINVLADHNLGYPSPAENSCDSSIENNCGTGKAALTTNGTAQDLFDDIWDHHCAVMPAGATGC